MMSLRLLALSLGALPLFAQIDGVVTNATTGKPQAGVIVNLIHPGENGMQVLGTATSGADGSFKINQPLPPPPALLQSQFQGVEYNMVVPPGSPTSGIKVSVYDATSQASDAAISRQHLILLEPQADAIHFNETFLVQNTGKTTVLDTVNGSVQFYLPKDARNGAKVTVQAPNGMPITRAPEKTAQDDVFKVGYPIKPGETEYDVAYSLPSSAQFSAKAVGKGQTLVVTPETVTLTSAGLKDDGIRQLGQGGPSAHVYEVSAKAGAVYEVSIVGTGALSAGNNESSQKPSEEEGGPPKERVGPPRLYQRLPWVLGLAFGILGLGGALLYRRSAA